MGYDKTPHKEKLDTDTVLDFKKGRKKSQTSSTQLCTYSSLCCWLGNTGLQSSWRSVDHFLLPELPSNLSQHQEPESRSGVGA